MDPVEISEKVQVKLATSPYSGTYKTYECAQNLGQYHMVIEKVQEATATAISGTAAYSVKLENQYHGYYAEEIVTEKATESATFYNVRVRVGKEVEKLSLKQQQSSGEVLAGYVNQALEDGVFDPIELYNIAQTLKLSDAMKTGLDAAKEEYIAPVAMRKVAVDLPCVDALVPSNLPLRSSHAAPKSKHHR